MPLDVIIATPSTTCLSDYAVAIFHEALRTGSYECYLRPDTRMPMMYIEDCLRALCEFMVAPDEQLKSRVYNVTAMSFTPEELANEIREHCPKLEMSYNPDSRQMIGGFNSQSFKFI